MRAIIAAMGLLLASGAPAMAQGDAQGGAQGGVQDDAQARLLAGACQGCHGVAGSSIPTIPRMQAPAEFVATMRAFRADQLENTIMGRIMRGYTDAEIAMLASHFAQRP